MTGRRARKLLTKILVFAGISVLIYFGIALGLIASQQTRKMPAVASLDFTTTLQGPDQRTLERLEFTARDRARLSVLHIPSVRPNAPLLILLHGSGWHGQQFDALATRLAKSAEVLVPDLRGHGINPQPRGDVAYIGQYEDDLADLIEAYQKDGQNVILGGHSSGGGLVVRFAGGPHGEMIDAAILMAPFLKYNAPTTRENSGGWARPLTRRLIGLSMLNNIGVTALNHLIVMQFSMPSEVLDGPLGHTATVAYSHRLNQSYAPRSAYLQDIAALPEFMLIAGTADEAFFAAQYAPLMRGVTDKGTYHLVDEVGHLDIVNTAQTQAHIETFLEKF